MKTKQEQALINQRFDDALESAGFDFWQQIANDYPEIKTGDLPFDIVMPLTMMWREAVGAWLCANSANREQVENLVHSDYV